MLRVLRVHVTGDAKTHFQVTVQGHVEQVF